ncbi:MAG: hypothetical protein M3346_10320, partial [Actinomycetota bacterium]|nr:hypothetical protein [Actinomycetota bacterium]
SVGSRDLEAVTFDPSSSEAWRRALPNIPLHVMGSGASRADSLRGYLRAKRRELTPNDFLTLLVPEVLKSRSLIEVLRNPGLTRLKASMLVEPDVQVMDLPITQDKSDQASFEIHEPLRNYVCVLVSGVHNATLQAMEFAETLRPTDIRAINFGLDPRASERLGDQWLEHGIQHPLEIEDSPFRDLGSSLTHYVRKFKADGTKRVVTVIIPEFITPKRRHRLLHNQTALTVKGRMLLEEGVVVVSVPYHLHD